MDSPPVQPSPTHDDHLERDFTLDQAVHFMTMAKRYKNLWVRELMRRGAPREVAYMVIELDHAITEAEAWHTEDDGRGNILAERQS